LAGHRLTGDQWDQIMTAVGTGAASMVAGKLGVGQAVVRSVWTGRTRRPGWEYDPQRFINPDPHDKVMRRRLAVRAVTPRETRASWVAV
jgi:hypothetical protein